MQINLASQPLRNDRPMLVASLATMALMTLVLGMQLHLISIERGEGTEAGLEIAETEARLQALAARESRLESELTRPDNEAVLERSLFLNSLLLRKGISWTLIFNDLEEVLPYNVKLVQVRPQVSAQNDLLLEMVVAAQTPEPVIEMLGAMESSKLFRSVAVTVSLPPTDSEPLYRYRLTVNYGRTL
jgi:type IV pilus assembly protein PilN